MTLDFSLTLSDELYADLIADCQECSCSPKQWASEAVESVIASRRLPKVNAAPQGARFGRALQDEREIEASLCEHRILL